MPRHRIIVFEMGDVVPRWNSNLPCIFVTATSQDWDKNSAILRGKQRSKSSFGSNSIRVIEELSERELVESEMRDVTEAKTAVAHALAAKGFTVNPEPSTRYIIYVARMDEKSLNRGPGPWVYVGMTSKSAEERLDEHRSMKRYLSSNRSSKHIRERAPELEPGEDFTTYSVYNALVAETMWGQALQKRGFKVQGPSGTDG